MNARRIERDHVLWALASLSLALIPHIGRFSLWMIVCFAVLGGWRIASEYGLLPLPNRRHLVLWVFKQLLAVVAFVAIYVSYQGEFGRDAGVALLTALLGLKMLELDNERDFYVVMFLAYFLVVTNFFYSQTLATASYMLLIVVIVTTGLIRFNAFEKSLDTKRAARLAATLVAQAMPLMAIGFFLFPRIPGPLWGLPQDSEGAITGLSNEMTIGHITELGVSDEIAFRVTFDGAAPPPQALYWRGPVMWQTDGRSWSPGHLGDGPARPVIGSGHVYRYTVTLEPHRKRWLFGIDAVINTDATARQTSDYRLLATQPVKRRLRYSFASQIEYRFEEITALEREAALQLPPDAHPRARELAAQWRAAFPRDQDLVAASLRHFNAEPFSYTLTPRRLVGDTVDEFLFESREGFCEHYAAAFVTLMRAAGIPARVVTGYQGGEFNTMSDYMIVRQRDAHAWSEVFLDGRGWVRVDPTGAVAPERVSLGINRALPQRALIPLLDANGPAGNLLRGFSNALDALNYNWSQWVLGYTPKRQRQLLDNAGLEDWDYGTLIIALTLSLAVIMVIIAVVLLKRREVQLDPAQSAYTRFCRKLENIGLRRLPSEGPLDFARRVVAQRADLAAAVAAITAVYTEVRYAGEWRKQQQLTTLVNEFEAR